MMNNLFSTFDYKNFFLYSFLLINLMIFLFINELKRMNKINMSMKLFNKTLNNNISTKNYFKSIFIITFTMNFLSLNLYSFSMTSQISFNMFMVLMMWVPIFILMTTKKKNNFFKHLLPYGISFIMSPMMILIETMSLILRPMTLILRLSINMTAGHILMTLMTEKVLNNSILLTALIFIYMMMKFLVSFIQAYIISTLLIMYSEEMYVKK